VNLSTDRAPRWHLAADELDRFFMRRTTSAPVTGAPVKPPITSIYIDGFNLYMDACASSHSTGGGP
jgi:hypothetical protein